MTAATDARGGHVHIDASTTIQEVVMHFLQELVLETLRRIQRFLDDNDALLGVVNQSSARKRLDETVAQIGSHAVAQVAGRRIAEGETAKQRTLRLALRSDHMRPVAVIAGQKLR